MWQWFKNLWYPKITIREKVGPDTSKSLGPYRESGLKGVEPNWYPPCPPAIEEKKGDLLSIIQGAIEEIAEDQAKVQQKYLTDEKLRLYFQAAMKCVASKLDTDGYDFVLVHQSDLGIPTEAFRLFMQIFSKACRQLGIEAEVEDGHAYITVRKPSVRKLIKTIRIKTPRVNIDEKVRAMLGQT